MNLLHWTAADFQAIAECVTAAVAVGALAWVKGLPAAVRSWFTARARRLALALVSREVAAFPRTEFNPDVSLEVGIAYAREAAKSGHPLNVMVPGKPTPDQPLDYLLAQASAAVWTAVGRPSNELNKPELGSLPAYMTALAGKAGLSPARDFALGVLTERVRQEEDGWPDQEGGGKRGPHGAGPDHHICLLKRKHDVEEAIYDAGDASEHS